MGIEASAFTRFLTTLLLLCFVRRSPYWNTTCHARLDLLDTSNESSRDVKSQVEFGL